eukprot:6435467-Alexandrium_andersonii.AAC.1
MGLNHLQDPIDDGLGHGDVGSLGLASRHGGDMLLVAALDRRDHAAQCTMGLLELFQGFGWRILFQKVAQ